MFIGRKKEIELLRQKNHGDEALLVAIYGRRRVGKTALIEEAFKDGVIWKFEGLEGGNVKDQIHFFLSCLALYTKDSDLSSKKVSGWSEVFRILSDKIGSQRLVIFLDEFQWMAGMSSHFVSLFKHAWDNFFQKKKNCIFVICGSISSFIVKKVLRSKALYGRVSREINLLPLTIKESSLLLNQRKPHELISFYMTLGGIPKYLTVLEPVLSYQQNLNELAFNQNGFFFQEFSRLLVSHFASTPHYEKILVSLLQGSRSPEQLAKDCGIEKGGSFSEVLDDLALAGFIEKETPIDKAQKSKLVRYRLLDEYLHFYFRFIYPNFRAIQKGGFSYPLVDPKTLAQWQGYAFERFCMRHAPQIAEALKFSGIYYEYGSWFSRKEPKAQVDLLFKRKDEVLTVCEMKYSSFLSGRLVSDFETRCRILQERFPSYSLHKVLMMGRKEKIPKKVGDYFDHVLFAEDVFL